MPRRDDAIRLRQMLDYAREAIALSKGRSRATSRLNVCAV